MLIPNLTIGTDSLTDANLSASPVKQELAELGSALNSGGEILLYGAHVGDNTEGQTFVNDLTSGAGVEVKVAGDNVGLRTANPTYAAAIKQENRIVGWVEAWMPKPIFPERWVSLCSTHPTELSVFIDLCVL